MAFRLALLAVLGGAACALGFDFSINPSTGLPIKWPAGSIPLRVLADNTTALPGDGTTRAASIVAAAQAWNASLGAAQFAPQIAGVAAAGNGNAQNEVVFASTIYGSAFDSNTLAVALTRSSGNAATESDVIFNSARTWDSYRGGQAGHGGAIDVRRVALHELGHVLGLGHPDEATPPQSVSAAMNSIISDVDTLRSDDLAGGQKLYGPPGVPVNNHFASAIDIPVVSGSAKLTGYNTNATKEPGEPQHADDPGGRSVWWKWTAPGPRRVTLITQGSIFDTTLGVYTGTAVSALTTIAASDDLNPGVVQYSTLAFDATGGTTYYFAVDGFDGDTGFLELTLTVAAAPVIETQPVSQNVIAGQSATFSVSATPQSGQTYQWRRNGVALSGATNATYTIASTTRSDADFYDVVVTANAVSTTSATVRLIVAPTSYPTSVGADPAYSVKLEAGSATVNVLTALADGRVLAGGDFVRINGHATSGVARFSSAGAIDATFVAPFFDGQVRALAVQSDGKILVGGDFGRVGEAVRFGVARLNPDGALDGAFQLTDSSGNPVGLSLVHAIVIAPDGKLLVAGNGTIIRFSADGALDPTFISGVMTVGPKTSLALAPNGKILVGGYLQRLSPPGTRAMVRLNADGSADPTFDAIEVNGLATSIALRSDGKIYVGGSFSFVPPHPGNVLRLNADGTRDTTFAEFFFATASTLPVLALALDGSGALQVATSSWIARYTSAGVFEPALPGVTAGSASGPAVTALLPRSDGGLWVAGNFTQIGSVAQEGIGRFAPGATTAGAVGTTVNRIGSADTLLPDASGRLIVGGNFRAVNGTAASHLARLTAAGALDPTFTLGTAPNRGVKQVIRQADGKLLVNGTRQEANGDLKATVVRLLVNGAADGGFGFVAANPGSFIAGLLAAPEGKSLIFGLLFNADNTSGKPILRLNPTGAIDSTFNAGGEIESAHFLGATLQPDARVVVVGEFKTFNGTAHTRIVRLLPGGALDPGFSTGSGFDSHLIGQLNPISLVQLTSGNRLAIAGNFSRYDGAAVSPLVKLTSSGPLDPTFAVPASVFKPAGVFTPPINGLLVQEDEKVLAWVGRDSPVSTTGAPRLQRVLANGLLDTSFQHVGLRITDHIAALAMSDAGQLYYSLANRGEVLRTMNVDVAPVITSPPVAQTVATGATATFSVTATGSPAPAFRWRRNGVPLAGATAATLVLANAQPADAGLYSVSVTNLAGSIVSAAVALTVTVPVSAPAISVQPVDQLVNAGAAVTFSMTVSGAGPFTYQWRRNGVDLPAGTAAELTLTGVQPADAGAYSVVITNASGSVVSRNVILSVIPTGSGATHAVVGSGYVAGRSVQITTTISYASVLNGLSYQLLLPSGWSYLSGTGAEGDRRPFVGTVDIAEWGWTTVPANAVTFTYTLGVPAGTTGEQQLAGLVTTLPGPVLFLAKPDPLRITAAPTHSADTNRDFEISLHELTRVIELYTPRHGTGRTGAYRVDATNLEDGFAADAPRAPGVAAALLRHHSADTRGATTGSPRDGALDLFELTRVIELYNTRAGTVRTGRYHVQNGTEDGFAAGP